VKITFILVYQGEAIPANIRNKKTDIVMIISFFDLPGVIPAALLFLKENSATILQNQDSLLFRD